MEESIVGIHWDKLLIVSRDVKEVSLEVMTFELALKGWIVVIQTEKEKG